MHEHTVWAADGGLLVMQEEYSENLLKLAITQGDNVGSLYLNLAELEHLQAALSALIPNMRARAEYHTALPHRT